MKFKINDKISIIPDGLDNNPVLYSMEAKYIQNKDCSDPTSNESFQELTINIENCTDKEKDMFFIIKTDRWAFDSVDDLIAILEDYKQRLKK